MRFNLSNLDPFFSALIPLGWTDLRAATWTVDHTADGEPARVVRHDGSTLSVVTANGSRVVRNTPHLDPQPTVGDWLVIDGVHVTRVLERTSLLRRMDADGDRAQALAANVDFVLITCGADRPIRATRIHRSVAQARDAGATPLLVLTKARTADDDAVDVPRLALEHPGVAVFETSALEDVGIERLRAAIGGRTSVLLGESGAGKSTLANALLGRSEAVTGEVRQGDAKGRHTTTSRNLHVLPGGGVIIDSPGIRSVGLFADADAVNASFTEIQQFAEQCRFGDCAHAGEPGCAVAAAVGSGDLDSARFESWLHLQREVASAARRSDPRAAHDYARRYGRAAKEGQARKRR